MPAGTILKSFATPATNALGVVKHKTKLLFTTAGPVFLYMSDINGNILRTISITTSIPGNVSYNKKNILLNMNSLYKDEWVTRKGAILKDYITGTTTETAFQPSGVNIWTANYSANLIYLRNNDGVIIKSFSSPGINPGSICIDRKNLIIYDDSTNLLYYVTRKGKVLKSFALPTAGGRQANIDEKYLWFANSATNLIYKLTKY